MGADTACAHVRSQLDSILLARKLTAALESTWLSRIIPERLP